MLVALAAVKRGSRKKRTSSMGCWARLSHAPKQISAATAMAKSPRTGKLVQPWLGASMMADTNDNRPKTDRAAPVQSTCWPSGLRDSGTSRRPARIATAATGTLTMNTEPHQKWSSKVPPTSGPRTTPRPTTPDQIPIANARSRASVNTLVRIDRVAGMMNAAAPPMTARAPTSWPTPVVNAATADAAPNTASPRVRARRRPKRSPSVPASSRRPAKTRV
jgi:hypothetical protein